MPGALAADPPTTVPSGRATPEGAACDLARAFIRDDPALLLATCIEPYGDADARAAYHRFLEQTVIEMKAPASTDAPSPEAPRSILRCYAARHLSKTPSTLAAYGFRDVMFVDVSAQLQNGSEQVCRTLVIQEKDGRWAADPRPELSPLKLEGLDDETPSTQEYVADAPGK